MSEPFPHEAEAPALWPEHITDSVQRSLLHFNSGMFAAAIDSARSVLEVRSPCSHPEAANLLAICAAAKAAMGNFAHATEQATQSLENLQASPPHEGQQRALVAGHIRLGHYQYANANYQEALVQYCAALKILPAAETARNAEIEGFIADCHANLGRLQRAILHARKALDNADTQPVLASQACLAANRSRLALYHAWQGRTELAIAESAALIEDMQQVCVHDGNRSKELACYMDRNAEILERARRLPEALESARQCVALLRASAGCSTTSLLDGLITLARLSARCEAHEEALSTCEEGLALIYRAPHTADQQTLRGHFLHIQGNSHAARGDVRLAKQVLLESFALHRKLALQSQAEIHIESQAEILTSLLRLHRQNSPQEALRFSTRAIALRYRLARRGGQPHQQYLLARNLVRHAHLLRKAQQPDGAFQACIRATHLICAADFHPPGLPHLCYLLSRELTASGKPIQRITYFFRKLASALSRNTLLGAPESSEQSLHHIQTFFRIWSDYFLQENEFAALIALQAFTHGRRLALYAQDEFLSRKNEGAQLAAPEQQLLRLRKQLQLIDLKLNGLIPAASALTIPSQQEVRALLPSLMNLRKQLHRRLLDHEARLFEQGGRSNRPELPDTELLQTQLGEHDALAVWFASDPHGIYTGDPFMLIVRRAPAPISCIRCPNVHEATQAFSGMLDSWNAHSHSTRTLRLDHPQQNTLVEAAPAASEARLWQAMAHIWQQLTAELGQPQQRQRIAMITQAATHNLPWLGACPASTHLTQYPSLNFYLADRNSTSPNSLPQKAEPLIIITSLPEDPAQTLYFAPLELAILRRIWGDAVIHLNGKSLSPEQTPSQAAAIWLIGHGELRPDSSAPQGIDSGIAWADNFPSGTGLFFASTCYLGRVRDVLGEPVGLPSLVAMRPETPCAAGAIAPLDDFSAALLALLFHYYWKQGPKTTREAFDCARETLANGDWPLPAFKLLAETLDSLRPSIRALAHAHAMFGHEKIQRAHPELSPAQQQQCQRSVRIQARYTLNLLEQTECSEALTSLLRDPIIRSAAHYWSWFG